MEDERFIPFYEAYKDYFCDSMEDVRRYLKNNNEEHRKVYQKLHNILDNNFNIQLLLDEQILKNGLSKGECKALLQVINLYYKLQDFEEKEIYFKGGMDAYFYFKKLGILR